MSEFWLYDSHGGHNPRLRGFRLALLWYWRLSPKYRNDSLLAVKSPLLRLELHLDGQWLRLWDPVVEDYLSTLNESDRERLVERAGRFEEWAEAQGRRDAEVRARAAEARVAVLEALTARLTASDSVSHKPKWPTSGSLEAGAASGTCFIASMYRLHIQSGPSGRCA